MKRQGKSAGTTTVHPRAAPRKSACKLGMKCPYKDEYQHQLEFSHDLSSIEKPATTFKPFEGKGRKLGGASTIANENKNKRSRLIDTETAPLIGNTLGINSREGVMVKSAIQRSEELSEDHDIEMKLAIRESLRQQQYDDRHLPLENAGSVAQKDISSKLPHSNDHFHSSHLHAFVDLTQG